MTSETLGPSHKSAMGPGNPTPGHLSGAGWGQKSMAVGHNEACEAEKAEEKMNQGGRGEEGPGVGVGDGWNTMEHFHPALGLSTYARSF